MNNIVFDFSVGDARFVSPDILYEQTSIVDLSIDEGNFYDPFGGGFIFRITSSESMTVSLGIPSLVEFDTICAITEVQKIHHNKENFGNYPQKVAIFGDENQDMYVLISPLPNALPVHETNFANFTVYHLESRIYGFKINRYLDTFWLPEQNKILCSLATSIDYKIFNQYFHLVHEFEAGNIDENTFLQRLSKFSQQIFLYSGADNQRVILLQREISRYLDAHCL